jgi:type VI secretion system protein ImpA
MQNLTALDDFLNDISSAKPEGEDLKYSQIYDDVRESQREDYDLPQGVWVQDLKSADWRQVEATCVDALKNKSKDLQVCAWLVEAWMHLYNFKGLKAGLELMLKLSEKYWDNGYPKLEEGDVEFRLAPYLWLNQKMAERVNNVRATQPNDPELHVHTFASYIDIQHYIGRKNEDMKSMSKDKLETLESFEKSLEKTDTSFFKELVDDANTTTEIAIKLEEFLDQKLEKDATSLHNLKNKIGDISRYCKQILSYRGADIDKKEAPSQENDSAAKEKGKGTDSDTSKDKNTNTGAADLAIDGKNIDITSVIRSRAHAYQIIREAAEFLEELDPHSPAPHLIKRAANWGRLSFPDLMRELVQDPSMQGEIRRLLGFPKEPEQRSPQSLPPQQAGYPQNVRPQNPQRGQQRQPSSPTAPGGWPFDDDFK